MFKHWVGFTCLYFLAVWLVFFFMAAQYPYHTAYRQARACWPPDGAPAANATRPRRGLDWCVHGLRVLNAKRAKPLARGTHGGLIRHPSTVK